MPEFSYRAYDTAGKAIDGTISAADQGTVVSILQQKGCYPVEISPSNGKPFRRHVSLRFGGIGRYKTRNIENFTGELSILLNAGVPLDRSLSILAEAYVSKNMRKTVVSILENLKSGNSLSQALDAQGGEFSRLYVNLIRAGEVAGTLPSVVARLNVYLQKSRELRDAVTSALIYPVILLIVAGLSLSILLMHVLPQFESVFRDSTVPVPASALFVLETGKYLSENWHLILLAALIVLIALKIISSLSAFREMFDRWILRLPLLGDLLTKLEMAKLCRTLGTLIGNGVNLLEAMTVLGDTISNSALRDEIGKLTENLKQGKGLSGPMAEAVYFPSLAVQMIRVGEETGQLDAMLEKVAEAYDREVTVALKRALVILEPCLILFLGLCIGGVIFVVLSALLSVNEMVV